MSTWPLPSSSLSRGTRYLQPYLDHLARHQYPVTVNQQVALSWKYKIIKWAQPLKLVFSNLNANKINYVVAKGFGAALQAYPTPFCRPFTDIDLYVEPTDFARAITILLDLGYSLKDLEYHETPFIHRTLSKQDWPPIELHFALSRDFSLQNNFFNDFINNTELYKFEDVKFPIPQPDYHAFYQLYHARNHFLCNTPIWLLDYSLLRHKFPKLDQKMSKLNRIYHYGRGLQAALHLCRYFFPPAEQTTKSPRLPPLDNIIFRSSKKYYENKQSAKLYSLLTRTFLSLRKDSVYNSFLTRV
ncbi:MAG: nucleotidyltransferase family protein [Myxococcota bacterium]